MVEITFTLDEQEHSITVEPDSGHPREVYKSGDKIAEKISSLGYEFSEDSPDYQELARAHRQSGATEKIELGDLSERVRGSPEPSDGSTSQDDDPSPSSDDIAIELVGPDGQGITRNYEVSQTMAQVRADIISFHGIDRDKTVSLYPSPAKSEELNKSESVTDFDGASIYWDLDQW